MEQVYLPAVVSHQAPAVSGPRFFACLMRLQDQMTKKRTNFNLIAVGVVVSLILIAVGAVLRFISSLGEEPERPPFKIVSSSPRQTFAVTAERKKLEVSKENPWGWKIYLSYTSQGRQVLNGVELDAGDSSSSPYWDGSPQLNWVYENTFRLDDTASLRESESDVLFVRNDSKSAISYLYVNGEANERFFILNLEPQATLKLYGRPQWKRRDSSWISASGQFTSGGKVYGGKNFRFPRSVKGPGCYCLSAKEDGIAIVSRDFEGWSRADLTSEQVGQIKEYYKKLETGQATEADKKAIEDIYSSRAEIITPKAPDCGAANAISYRH
jgi:hypothetical protein